PRAVGRTAVNLSLCMLLERALKAAPRTDRSRGSASAAAAAAPRFQLQRRANASPANARPVSIHVHAFLSGLLMAFSRNAATL
ncbi:MAG: hypothetical protein VXZ39_04265, partial [Planctomycetota bacterium]|nr:hypothetical protein [Planctomycetota bacterium]